MVNRREAIKTIGGLAGAATLSKLLPGCGDGGGDGPDYPVFVYMMLENRTFDHVLGARKLLHGLPGDGLTSAMANPDMGGVMHAPFEPTLDAMCVFDPPHGWDASHAQWNNGANDGFITQYQIESGMSSVDTMQYLTRTQVPITWALADAYTICDRWHASVMGPTLPNRAYWHTATSFGLKVNNDVITSFAAVPVPTIYNRLTDKNVEWVYYFGSLAVVSLLGNPGPYQLDLGPADGTGRVRHFAQYADQPGDPKSQFFKDCAAGKLPPVVYIDPFFGGGGNDDHPPTHPIMAQSLIAAVYTALAKSPQWKNVTLVITYDEHGGFFDHVSPGQVTDDTLANFGIDGFQQLGFRVPALVIGPYAKKGYVSSVQYDHTSALKHLQSQFGLEPLNARMDMANDLSDCLDLDRMAKGKWEPPIELPTINLDDWPMDAAKCIGGGFRATDPITEWADANPDKITGYYDRREHRDSYMEGIREFLRRNQGG